MKKAVIYTRFSSQSQQEQSIEGQIRACTSFCQTHNYEVVNVYSDRAKTGRNFNRPEFIKMMEDASKHLFEIVVVYQLDRFGRNVSESILEEQKLKKLGIKLLSATELITSENDELNDDLFLPRGLVRLFAENYSRDLSKKVKRGLKERYYKRNSAGGILPIGYKSKDKKIVVDQVEAEIVKEAFKRRLQGQTITEIYNYFKNNGFTRSNGSLISRASLHKMFSVTKYIGKFVNPYDSADIITDMFPPIIDENTFMLVNSIENNPHKYRKKTDMQNYVLIGKLFDAETGAAYKAYSGTSCTKRLYRYYKFNSVKLPKTKFEKMVYDAVCSFLNNPKRKEQIADLLYKESSKRKDTTIIDNLNKELKELKMQQKEIARKFIFCDKSMEASLNEISKETQNRINHIENRISIETSKLLNSSLDKDGIKYLITKLFSKKITDPVRIAKSLDITINAIYRSKDTMVVYLKLNNDKFVTYQDYLSDLEEIKKNSSSFYETKVHLTFCLAEQERLELSRQLPDLRP